MNEREVSAAEQLDARLTLNAMRKHAQLWAIAEGRFGWRDGVALLAPLLLIAFGVTTSVEDFGWDVLMRERGGAVYIVLGVLLFASFMYSYRQRQLDALLEIVRRLERDRS